MSNYTDEERRTCHTCGALGHWTQQCPDALCLGCGLNGHVVKNCLNMAEVTCYSCNEKGHTREICTGPGRPEQNRDDPFDALSNHLKQVERERQHIGAERQQAKMEKQQLEREKQQLEQQLSSAKVKVDLWEHAKIGKLRTLPSTSYFASSILCRDGPRDIKNCGPRRPRVPFIRVS
jgi:hypothetical protein